MLQHIGLIFLTAVIIVMPNLYQINYEAQIISYYHIHIVICVWRLYVFCACHRPAIFGYFKQPANNIGNTWHGRLNYRLCLYKFYVEEL